MRYVEFASTKTLFSAKSNLTTLSTVFNLEWNPLADGECVPPGSAFENGAYL